VGPYRNLKRQAKKDSPGYTQYPCREKKGILKEQQVHLTGENDYEKIQQRPDKSDI
jgi:hypothetical protein